MPYPDNLHYITATIRNSEGQKRTFYIAYLTTMAIMLSVIEHAIPKPFPWMRIGLANAITLYAFTLLAPREVLYLILGRIIATSLVIGTFLSITFILSASGALSSFVVMLFLFRYAKKIFSLVGVSICGAITSNLVQLMVVNTLFINSRISYYFIPFLILFALSGGMISGFFGKFLVDNI